MESWKKGLWNEPQKHLLVPGPTNNELIFLESSMFSSAAVPKILISLDYQKNLSVQSQLIFIPKLHNQGFTCRVFFQIMKPLFFVSCAPFVLDDVIQWFIKRHFGVLCLDFELCNSFIVIWRTIVPSFFKISFQMAKLCPLRWTDVANAVRYLKTTAQSFAASAELECEREDCLSKNKSPFVAELSTCQWAAEEAYMTVRCNYGGVVSSDRLFRSASKSENKTKILILCEVFLFFFFHYFL